MVSKGALAAFGLALVGGALALYPAPESNRSTIDKQAIAQELDSLLRETSAGVHSRASTLSELPRLSAAVSTDAATLRDLTQDELAFRPQPGETITVGQVPIDARPNILLVLPDGASAVHALDKSGIRLEIEGGRLRVTDVQSVRARDHGDDLRGAIGVSWPVELQSVRQKLDAVGAGLRVDVKRESLGIGAHAALEGGAGYKLEPLSLGSELGRTATFVIASVAPAPPLPLRPIGLGLAALSLLAGIVLLARGGSFASTAPANASSTGGISLPPSATVTAQPPLGTLPGPEVAAGSVIQNTYELVRPVGKGGMGVVWEAHHLRLPGKKVAIKLLSADFGAEVLARFQREAEVTSKLGHPNIVGVLDFNKLPSGAPYIVLEFLEGESLGKKIEGGRVPLDQALEITRQIGSALHAAHRANVVHRDLKPDNIFLVPTEADSPVRFQVKVLDFGISKIRGALNSQTRDNAVFGTPQYMSPEQAYGKNSSVDARSDIWSLGVIVYEMLTGTRAFDGETITDVIGQIVFKPSPSLDSTAGLPPQVRAAVDRALAKEPDDRFPDMPSFVAALTS